MRHKQIIKSKKSRVQEDVTSTYDGVSSSTEQFLSEKDPESQSHIEVIKDFIKFCRKNLRIATLPRAALKKDARWSSENKTFGHYNPNDNSLVINLAGRNIMDILRTTAHELVHCKQFEDADMPANAGETGSPAENHANSAAGILMREYAQLHPELFQMPVLSEASGYIPTAAQAHDPRFEMALSCDVHPGTLGQVANAFDLNTDSQGHPQIARPDGIVKRLAESLARELQSITEQDRAVDEAISKTGEYGKAAKIVRQAIAGAAQQFRAKFPQLRETESSYSQVMAELLARSLSDNFNMYFNIPVRFEDIDAGGMYNNDGTITISSKYVEDIAERMVDALMEWSSEPGKYDDQGNLWIDISDFTEYDELAQEIFQTRPRLIKEIIETFIHEYVHAEQHNRVAQRSSGTVQTVQNQYNSYLQRNQALFNKAVQSLETDEDWRAYLSSPQEITAHGHDLANELIQTALGGRQLEDIEPERAEAVIDLLKSTLQQAANYRDEPKYQQYDVFDRDVKQHRKVVNRFLKTVYQEVAGAIRTLQNKLMESHDEVVAEAQSVAKMMPAVKLWKGRVKIKQSTYTGYVEATVTAPDMRTARNMLKALYNVPEHEVGSVTLVK